MTVIMYRVLIVDDEKYVVDWLSTLLESQTEPEMDVCRAYSAAEALNWLNRAKIDIVVTDICMPEMSGITLAEKVKRNWPGCKVILLTAHAEFDYAYEAIKNNVISYILKTEDDVRILAEVHRAVELLDSEMKNLELLGQVHEQLSESISVIRKEIILNILKGDCAEQENLFDQLENIGAGISPEMPFILFAGRIENSLPGMNIVERFRQFNSIEKIVEQYLRKYMDGHFVEYGFNRIVWLMQPKNETGIEAHDTETAGITGHEAVFAGGMLETIQQSCMEMQGISISFVLHGAPLHAKQLAESFHSLERLLNLHTSQTAGIVITDTALADSTARGSSVNEIYPEMYCMPNIVERLKSCLENNRQEEFMAELERIAEELKKNTSWHSNAALENYYSVAIAIFSFINQRKLAEKIAFRIGLYGLFQPYIAGSWSKAADYLRRLAEILFELQKESEGLISNNVIRFLREYISGHISEDISLVRLSEVSGYNASYLSRFFRENTGVTLNEYISRQKVNKIKELMNNGSLNISDVASKAGFESRTYFNRFVKKATGMSPQELRNFLLRG